jgi:hypothetical protein
MERPIGIEPTPEPWQGSEATSRLPEVSPRHFLNTGHHFERLFSAYPIHDFYLHYESNISKLTLLTKAGLEGSYLLWIGEDCPPHAFENTSAVPTAPEQQSDIYDCNRLDAPV